MKGICMDSKTQLIRVIAFMGKAGSGKTTAATHLVRKYGFIRLSFSDGLKMMLYRGLGIGQEYLYGGKKNECPEELCGRTARHAMITLGTEWGRNLIHPDIWVKAMEKSLSECMYSGTDKFVIDDVRFLNEADWVRGLANIKKIGVSPVVENDKEIGTNPVVYEIRSTLVNIVRYSKNDIDHQSETEQDGIIPDSVIRNNGTMESLCRHIDLLI